MRQSTSNSTSSADLQLTHHNFRWVLFSVHAEPVRGLLARQLRRRLAAEAADGQGPTGEGQDPDDAMERVVSWLPKVWNHVNRFLEAHCFADVTIGLYKLLHLDFWKEVFCVGARRLVSEAFCKPAFFENLYSPSKHGRQQTISNTNEIKQLKHRQENTRSSLRI